MTLRAPLLSAALACFASACAHGQSVTFDFDSGTPVLGVGVNTPFEQTTGGITARFSSPSGAAFSLQSASTTGWKMSRFSGNFLYDNNTQDRSTLSIQFSRALTNISLTFATPDFDIEVPSNVQLTAYLDSNQSTPVGTATSHGAYIGDTMPTGTLSFDSGGRPFNIVEIVVPLQGARNASSFFADNIVATPATVTHTVTTVSAASYASGAPVAPGSIASAFGQGMSSGTEGATSVPLPTKLADTTVTVRDSAGIERPVPLFYVSPGQINFMTPEASAAGTATVTVTSGTLPPTTGSLQVASVAPGLFTASQDGKGIPAGEAITVAPDLTQTKQPIVQCGATPASCVAVPIDLGPAGTQVILTLYGTGIRGRSSLSAVTARIAGLDAQVLYAGPQPEYVGLDQVNIAIPAALAGRGDVDVVLTVDGKAANTVRVNIK